MKYQSNILSDARGKMNGMVFTRGRYGAVIRNKVSPVQPNSSPQQLVKQNFGALSASWRDLPAENISAWNNAAQNWPRSNVFGQTYYQSGLNLYVGLNQNLLQAGGATITLPPEPSEMPVMEFLSATVDASTPSLITAYALNGATVIPVGYTLVLESTGPVSAGRRFVKNLFRYVDRKANPIDTGTENYVGNYSVVFGAPAAGQTIWFRAKLIDEVTGQSSLYVQGSTVVVA